MLTSLKNLFDSNRLIKSIADQIPSDENQHEQEFNLALVALLLEIALADNNFDFSERKAIAYILENKLGFDPKDISLLIERALSAYQQASSTFEFTKIVNAHFSYKQKCEIIAYLWQVAYSDSHLDRLEEYNIRKISDLIYVKHSDFIYAKLHYSKLLND